MISAKYSQKWVVSLPQTSAWDLMLRCLADSKRVKEWPNRMANLFCLGAPLQLRASSTASSKVKHLARSRFTRSIEKGAEVQAVYKMGPIKKKVFYCIQNIVEKHKIIYRTTSEHLLFGTSEIVLRSVKNGTEIHWHGVYESKGLQSIPALIWFKTIYEPLFFYQFKRSTQRFSKHLNQIESVA